MTVRPNIPMELTSLVRRSGVHSPWSSMIRLRREAYPLTGNRPEPVVSNDRSRSLPGPSG